MAKWYDITDLFTQDLMRSTIMLADIKEGDFVLDVGCGTGSLTILEKKEAGYGGYVAGIDAASEMIEIARNKAVKEDLEIDFRIGLIEDITYQDNYFDVATSSFMTHHLPRKLKRAGLEEVYRVLKPKGHFLIVDFGRPDNFIVKGFYYPLYGNRRVYKYLSDKFTEITFACDNFRGYLSGLVQDSGFDDVKVVKKEFGFIDFISARKRYDL